MRGQSNRILYVGQSKNLRTRLAFYKNANPDRVPRRLTRLVHEVESIDLERCPTAAAARMRELELLRTYRPRFNRADTGPCFSHYIDWQSNADEVVVRLHLDAPTHPKQERTWHGPIRGRVIPCQAFAALQRLAICAIRQIERCSELPLLPQRLTHVVILDAQIASLIPPFLKGESLELVEYLLEKQSLNAEPVLRQLHACDAESLLTWSRALQDL